jgi:hypothetical protein
MMSTFFHFRYSFVRLILIFTLVFVHLPHIANAQVSDWESDNPENSCMVDGVPTLKCLEVVYSNILYLASFFVMLILFVMILYAGFMYMTSFGNANKIKKATDILKWSIIGVGVFAVSYLIIFVIDTAFFGGQGELLRFNLPGPYDE